MNCCFDPAPYSRIVFRSVLNSCTGFSHNSLHPIPSTSTIFRKIEGTKRDWYVSLPKLKQYFLTSTSTCNIDTHDFVKQHHYKWAKNFKESAETMICWVIFPLEKTKKICLPFDILFRPSLWNSYIVATLQTTGKIILCHNRNVAVTIHIHSFKAWFINILFKNSVYFLKWWTLLLQKLWSDEFAPSEIYELHLKEAMKVCYKTDLMLVHRLVQVDFWCTVPTKNGNIHTLYVVSFLGSQ